MEFQATLRKTAIGSKKREQYKKEQTKRMDLPIMRSQQPPGSKLLRILWYCQSLRDHQKK